MNTIQTGSVYFGQGVHRLLRQGGASIQSCECKAECVCKAKK